MFLSLSSSYACYACAIRQSINNYTANTSETQFFDWLVCSMKSVNEVLTGKPIIFKDSSAYINSTNTISIDFFNFDRLISHHDISKLCDNSINEITEKYIRRYKRIINTIKEKSKIFFIRYCKNLDDLEEEEIHNFFRNINFINPDLIFTFILVSDCDNLLLPDDLLLKENFKYINLNDYIDDDINNETNEYFKNIKKYKCIFTIINNNYNI